MVEAHSHGTPFKPKGACKSKLFALVGVEVALFSVVGISFWFQDLRYALPAPVPKGWNAPRVGSRLPSAGRLASPLNGKPTVFNFYSSDCPCSRFNLDHVRSLQAEFGEKVKFVLVLEGGSKEDEEGTFRGLNLSMEPFFDVDGQLAKQLGVYATPQAAVVDATGRLVYRGNYNRSRYCSDPQTEFARMATGSLISGRELSPAIPLDGPAYGCAIPATSNPKDWR